MAQNTVNLTLGRGIVIQVSKASGMKENKHQPKSDHWGAPGSGGALYGLGLIGAAVYYVPRAHTFVHLITALGKALIWPAIVVYSLLLHLHS